jgi:hypothetical protein
MIPYNSAMRRNPSFVLLLLVLSSQMTGCNAVAPHRAGGALGGDGWQACEAERPKVCTMIYDPVCARRGNGEVADYASPCNACADVTVTGWHPETCEE